LKTLLVFHVKLSKSLSAASFWHCSLSIFCVQSFLRWFFLSHAETGAWRKRKVHF